MTAKTIVRWYGKLLNDRVRRRLHGDENTRLHRNHLLVSFVGRKSGKSYTLPVNYCITDEGTYVMGTEANWRHNFVDGIVVELQVAGERVSGHAVQITDDSARRNRLGRMLTGLGWLLFSGSLTIIEVTPEYGLPVISSD